MMDQIITSTVLLIAMIGISAFFEKRMNPCIKYALWLVVAVKLLVPVPEFENAMNILNVVEKLQVEHTIIEEFVNRQQISVNESDEKRLESETAVSETNRNEWSDIEKTIEAENIERNSVERDSIEKNNIERDNAESNNIDDSILNIDLIFAAKSIWICGILVCGGIFLWSNLKFRWYLHKKRKFLGKYKGCVPIYHVKGIASACLFGIFSPVIYLDATIQLDEIQREYVLAHEYTHFRHGDFIWSVVRCICVVVYWFNPFAWWAAHRCMADSELACDAGTLKQIGIENSLEYGKTLIEIARITTKKKNKMQFFECSTSAAGGIREMKKRVNLIVKRPNVKIVTAVLLAAICIGAVGCTFGNPAEKEDVLLSTENAAEGSAETEIQTESISETETAQVETDGIIEENPDSYIVYNGITLYRESDPDKVCIWIAPPGARQYLNYCYIPEGKTQEKLLSFMENLEEEWQEHNRRWKGMKETGYQISYKGRNYFVFEGSFLYAMDSDEEKGPIELFVKQEELCGFVQELLEKELDYISYDITQIKDIVSAELEMRHWLITDEENIRQTITDKESLEKFENWFSNAEYILFGADCGNASSCLTLTLADGEEVKLSVATDSCPNFGINGVYYDYRPNSKFDNREFFKCFDEIYENVLKEHYE